VDVGVQEAFGLGEWQGLEFLGDLSDHGHLDADELVALAVLAGAGLEEPG
jgi:hypothetical protein